MKQLIGQEDDGLNLDELDKSVINEIMSSFGDNNTQLEQINTNHEAPSIRIAHINSYPKDKKKSGHSQGPIVDEDWKWREPTDEENDSDRDDGGGLTLKVHSSILDESVNISNLNVSFNAALHARSRSAEKRKKAERHEQKVVLMYCNY